MVNKGKLNTYLYYLTHLISAGLHNIHLLVFILYSLSLLINGCFLPLSPNEYNYMDLGEIIPECLLWYPKCNSTLEH